MADLPHTHIEGGIADLTVEGVHHKSKQDRSKHSGWLLNISTNYRPQSTAESYEMGNKLSAALRKLLAHEGLRQILVFQPEGHHYSKKYIEDVKGNFAVELGRGKFGGAIHAHAVLHVKHKSKLKLDFAAIRQFMVREIDDPKVKSIYLNVRMIRDSKNLEEYIKKDIV